MAELEKNSSETEELKKAPETKVQKAEKTTPKKTEGKLPKKAEKKPNVFVRAGRRIKKWFRDLVSEAKKVIWPTGKQTFKNTVVVIVCILVVAIFVYILDIVFSSIRDLIVTLVG